MALIEVLSFFVALIIVSIFLEEPAYGQKKNKTRYTLGNEHFISAENSTGEMIPAYLHGTLSEISNPFNPSELLTRRSENEDDYDDFDLQSNLSAPTTETNLDDKDESSFYTDADSTSTAVQIGVAYP